MLIGASYDLVLLLEALFRSKVVMYLLDFLITPVWGVGFVCCLIAYGNGSFRGFYLVFCLCGIVIYLITIHRLFRPLVLRITKSLQKCRRFRRKK